MRLILKLQRQKLSPAYSISIFITSFLADLVTDAPTLTLPYRLIRPFPTKYKNRFKKETPHIEHPASFNVPLHKNHKTRITRMQKQERRSLSHTNTYMHKIKGLMPSNQ